MGLIQNQQQTGSRLRVAIAGYDVEGQATYRYLSRQSSYDITILDEREVELPAGAQGRLGPGVFDQELDFDQVWRTPGLPPWRLKTTAPVYSGTIEFMNQCPAPVIGVTGTKGKGTTATLISQILAAAGQKTHLVGNIGQPALDSLDQIKPEDSVVYELSSFQLWDVKTSPAVAVVLMVEPEHLDRHKDLEDYLTAKSNIARWQDEKGVTVYHPTNRLSARVAKPGLGRKVKYLDQTGAYIKEGRLVIGEQEICSVAEFGLPGVHNHENIAAAVTAAWQIKPDSGAAARAIKTFKGLPHRLQTIAEKNGITFVDDSFATTPATAVAAAASFAQPKVMILGGSDKGSDYGQLARQLKSADIRRLILIGQTGPAIKAELDKVGLLNYELVPGGMGDIVERAAKVAEAGDVVLLSPACASFDMFDDYVDRAEQFKRAVEKL